MKQVDVTIVGGGASGILLALALARPDWVAEARGRQTAALTASSCGLRVLLIEAQEQVGKKLLATGNGRCNYAPLQACPKDYHGSLAALSAAVLEGWSADDMEAYLQLLGMESRHEEDRRYPRSMRAQSLRGILERALRRAGVELLLSTTVERVERENNHYLLSAVKEGEELRIASDSVVLATGGMVQPSFPGVAGSGYRLAQPFGLRCSKILAPALTTLKFTRPFKQIAGLRVEAKLTLAPKGKKPVAVESGELLFTDYGLSGIPTLSASYACSQPNLEACIDLFPEYSVQELVTLLLQQAERYPEEALEDWALGLLPEKIGRCLLTSLKQLLPANRDGLKLSSVPKAFWTSLATEAKAWRFEVKEARGFEVAQVTHGGLLAEGFRANSLESRQYPGLYAVGELLDVDGICGGYNLLWAWSSAIFVADAILREGGRRK